MKHPSPSAKTAPVGTRYTPATPLTEQRLEGTYHQRMPWPDQDATRLQNAMLDRPGGSSGWFTALTCLLAVFCGLMLVKGCT